jgi:hypothetical protein
VLAAPLLSALGVALVLGVLTAAALRFAKAAAKAAACDGPAITTGWLEPVLVFKLLLVGATVVAPTLVLFIFPALALAAEAGVATLLVVALVAVLTTVLADALPTVEGVAVGFAVAWRSLNFTPALALLFPTADPAETFTVASSLPDLPEGAEVDVARFTVETAEAETPGVETAAAEAEGCAVLFFRGGGKLLTFIVAFPLS